MSMHPGPYFLRGGGSSRQPLPSNVGRPRVTGEGMAVAVIEAPPTERDRVRAALVAAGLSLPAPAAPVAGQLSPEQREELAHRISVGTPLSQIVIEERRGR
jgi:hypothetical protein